MPATEAAVRPPTEGSRRSYLEGLQSRSGQGDGSAGNLDVATTRRSEPIADRRVDLIVGAIAELVDANLLRPSFSVLHIESGDGEVLARIRSAFPDAECYGVDWPDAEAEPAGPEADPDVPIYRFDLSDLFLTRRGDKRARFDLVIMSGRFEPVTGSPILAKQADYWLEKNARYVVGVAAPDRVEELQERGTALQFLEPADDGGQLLCWSAFAPLTGEEASRPGRIAGGLSFPRWFWQNLRRHGLRDALYYGARVMWAVLDGRLPMSAAGDSDLRTRFCATLTPRRRVRTHTVYVFVFLGEFGYEVLNWQGVVRKFAGRLPSSSKIVIAGRRGLQPFYEGAAQYIEIDDIPEYRESHAAAYFAMSPDEFRRYLPPTEGQFAYDRDLRRTIESHVRRVLKVKAWRTEFVFSSQMNAIGDCIFGVDPRFYGLDSYHGSIYGRLDLANNSYACLRPDDTARAGLEEKLGFSLDEPYVLVQGRRRTIGPQKGSRELDTDAVIAELAKGHRVVYLGFRSGRYLDSGSFGPGGAVTAYEAESFVEQSCLIAHASLCVFTTEGDLGSHTYLPPLLGRNVAVFASREVFEARSAPVEFWNRNVFRFGGQMIPWIADELDTPEQLRAAIDELRGTRDGAHERPPAPPAPTKRILFVLRHEGYVRNCEYVIEQLAEQGHSLHIALSIRSGKRHDADVLRQLTSRRPSIKYRRLSHLPIRAWDDAVGLARVTIDYLRYLEPGYESAARLRARATRQVPSTVLRVFDGKSAGRRRGTRALTNRLLHGVERISPSHYAAEDHLSTLKPDVVVFTPLLDGDFVALDYLKSAQALGIPTALCVASWDNLSSKGLIQIVPDRVIVWNDVQKEEAVRMHDIPPARVVVTGAHLFDHWFEMRPSCSREEFCERRGLDPDEPFLLYVCSSGFVTADEVPFVRRWIEEIRAADSPLARAGILVRPHGANRSSWEQGDDLSDLPGVTVWPPLGEGPVDDRSKQNYFDSLVHSAGVIGINTSALIEGGIAGKHVFTILADEFRETQVGTVHFHYLVDGGLLTTAETLAEHVEQLDRVLIRGDRQRDEARAAFIESFIRPRGLDVPASPLAVQALEDLIEESPPVRSKSTTAGTAVTRVLTRPLVALEHMYVRSKRSKTLDVSAPEPGIGLINRQRALAGRRQQTDADKPGKPPRPKRPAAKRQTTPEKREAKQEALMAKRLAKRAAKREERQTRGLVVAASAGGPPGGARNGSEQNRDEIGTAVPKARVAKAERQKLKAAKREMRRQAEASRQGSAAEAPRAEVPLAPAVVKNRAVPATDWAGQYLSDLEQEGVGSPLEGLYLWPRTPVAEGADLQAVIKKRVGASDYEVDDPRSRSAMIIVKLRSLVADPDSGLGEDFRVLDIACGDAVVLWQIQRVFPDASCYGVDCNKGVFEPHAQVMKDGVLLYKAYLQHLFPRLPAGDRKFDVTLMLNTYRGWESADLREEEQDLPQQADEWFATGSRYVIVTATNAQIHRLRQEGWSVEVLGKGEDESTMICMSRGQE